MRGRRVREVREITIREKRGRNEELVKKEIEELEEEESGIRTVRRVQGRSQELEERVGS